MNAINVAAFTLSAAGVVAGLGGDAWPCVAGSMIVVPVRIPTKVYGVLTFFRAEPERYSVTELATAEDLALRAALAVENAELHRREQAAVRARDVSASSGATKGGRGSSSWCPCRGQRANPATGAE